MADEVTVCGGPNCGAESKPPQADFPAVGQWANGVETTGPAPYGAQPQAAPPAPAAQPTWSLNGLPDFGVGLLVGGVQGLTPTGGLYQPPLTGSRDYELGRGLGMTVAGALEFLGGGGLALGGGVICFSGVGCFGGAPAMALGAAAAANGATSVAAGERALLNALNQNNSFSKGQGSGGQGGRSGSNIPQKYRNEVGTKSSNPHIQRTLDEIQQGSGVPRDEIFQNRHGLLPEGRYEYYKVLPPGARASDWRLVHEINSGRWYYSGNFHAEAGQAAQFAEIIDPFL